MSQATGGSAANPVLVEVTRGDGVESVHRGAAAVFDSSGSCVAAWGDVAQPVFPRSAIKSLQALPLIETGAADAFAVTQQELALACASHSGEPAHAETAARWLDRVGPGVAALACGAHLPMNDAAMHAMIRADTLATPAHNNCSGKHAGMITTAVHLGEPIAGYETADHPVQQRVRQAVEEMAQVDLSAAPMGIDGCSIPTLATPLTALARAMARIANPAGLGSSRAAACARLRAAMAAHPFMVAGSGRCDTAVMERTGEAAFVKTGAEGVYCAGLAEKGLGLALKIDDGARRASEVALLALLRHLGALDAGQIDALGAYANPPVTSRRGVPVGEVRAAAGWL